MKKALAALLAMAIVAASAPAFAGGWGHGGYGHGGYGHGYFKYGYRGHGGGHYGAALVGGLLAGALIGGILSHPAPRYAAPAQPQLGNCKPTTGTGYANGRRALYGGTACFDAWGNMYVTPGSEYFIRYLQ